MGLVKEKRTPTQIHTRWLDRRVAHTNMRRAGLKRVNKHDYSVYTSMTGMTVQQRLDSYFARNWRDYIDIPTVDLRRKTK